MKYTLFAIGYLVGMFILAVLIGNVLHKLGKHYPEHKDD